MTTTKLNNWTWPKLKPTNLNFKSGVLLISVPDVFLRSWDGVCMNIQPAVTILSDSLLKVYIWPISWGHRWLYYVEPWEYTPRISTLSLLLWLRIYAAYLERDSIHRSRALVKYWNSPQLYLQATMELKFVSSWARGCRIGQILYMLTLQS